MSAVAARKGLGSLMYYRSFFSLITALSFVACMTIKPNLVRQEGAVTTPHAAPAEKACAMPLPPPDPDPDHLGVNAPPPDINQRWDWAMKRFMPAYSAFMKSPTNVRACDKERPGKTTPVVCVAFRERQRKYAQRFAEEGTCTLPWVQSRDTFRRICQIAEASVPVFASK